MKNDIKKYQEFNNLKKDMFGNVELPEVSDRFWEFVNKVNWRVAGEYKYDYIIQVISPHFTVKEFEQFSNEYDLLYKLAHGMLKEAWLGDPGLNVSDDGYSDLISTIIGYGKDFYYSILEAHLEGDHTTIREMADNSDYKENFGYVFHILADKTQMKKWTKGKK